MKVQSEVQLELKLKASTMELSPEGSPPPCEPGPIAGGWVIPVLFLVLLVRRSAVAKLPDRRLSMAVRWEQRGSVEVTSGPSTEGQEQLRIPPSR